jgi:hypothetical protein
MKGLTNYITERPWSDIITAWYVRVDDTYQILVTRRGAPFRISGSEPELADSEVITISLIIETFFQGHEEVGYAFVGQYLRELFPQLLDLDRFNQRRRALIAVMEAIRRQLCHPLIDDNDPVRLVDSAPITLMTYTRGARCQSVDGNDDYFGVVTSKKGKFFGLRLHVTSTVNQVIDDWVLAPGSEPDPQVLDELVFHRRNLTLIGDKIYNDAVLEDRLWQKRRITLLPLRKCNQKKQWPKEAQRILGHVRHRVETVFSTVTTVFNIQRPRGRSLAGHVVRIATCILAYTLSFFMI